LVWLGARVDTEAVDDHRGAGEGRRHDFRPGY
jgi:hypothetical protein